MKPEVVGFPVSTQAKATLKLRQRCGLLTAQTSAVEQVFEAAFRVLRPSAVILG
jgi:hypothetical protein